MVCLMAQTILNYLTTIILSILFPLARWATIKMPSNNPPNSVMASMKEKSPSDCYVLERINNINYSKREKD